MKKLSRTQFIKKPRDFHVLIPKDCYVINKIIYVSAFDLAEIMNRPSKIAKHIQGYENSCFVDERSLWHVLYITSMEVDYGFLVDFENGKVCFASFLKRSEVHQ